MKNTRQPVPRARKAGLIVKKLPDETLVYDLDRHVAHCLNETAAMIWSRCDGKTTTTEITRLLGEELQQPVDQKVVWLALDQLGKHNLLTKTPVRPPSVGAISRRELVRNLGLAAAVAIPAVVSIAAPFPAQAATCKTGGQPCTSGLECCSMICNANVCAP